ncbi:hypothetical protein F3Y22_tig00110220pilonHSYRG00010 [Hibiscus syriacus]|uniref:Uncharacterized protein n=1 Tax=Hibiscus syriacus TaxID=106335 RepID=A0A6A3BBI6_HIBSY|nr:hypothetical protein F3Y22_tig00110220pilonHSYRG00010 [Hibiscus syriacus]
MELGDVSDDEKVMARKMIVTFLVYTITTSRSAFDEWMLRMLESDVEVLEMPPKPFHQLPLDSASKVRCCESSRDEPSTSLDVGSVTD